MGSVLGPPPRQTTQSGGIDVPTLKTLTLGFSVFKKMTRVTNRGTVARSPPRSDGPSRHAV